MWAKIGEVKSTELNRHFLKIIWGPRKTSVVSEIALYRVALYRVPCVCVYIYIYMYWYYSWLGILQWKERPWLIRTVPVNSLTKRAQIWKIPFQDHSRSKFIVGKKSLHMISYTSIIVTMSVGSTNCELKHFENLGQDRRTGRTGWTGWISPHQNTICLPPFGGRHNKDFKLL